MADAPPPTPLYSPQILSEKTHWLDVEKSDCRLVGAASVSGRGNALIDPVKVKDSGACKADSGFVLLMFQSDCYNLDLEKNKKGREKEQRGKGQRRTQMLGG